MLRAPVLCDDSSLNVISFNWHNFGRRQGARTLTFAANVTMQLCACWLRWCYLPRMYRIFKSWNDSHQLSAL